MVFQAFAEFLEDPIRPMGCLILMVTKTERKVFEARGEGDFIRFEAWYETHADSGLAR